jgi:hypothetical protein
MPYFRIRYSALRVSARARPRPYYGWAIMAVVAEDDLGDGHPAKRKDEAKKPVS